MASGRLLPVRALLALHAVIVVAVAACQPAPPPSGFSARISGTTTVVLGEPYLGRVVVRGGRTPYRFTVSEGLFAVSSSGRLTGTVDALGARCRSRRAGHRRNRSNRRGASRSPAACARALSVSGSPPGPTMSWCWGRPTVRSRRYTAGDVPGVDDMSADGRWVRVASASGTSTRTP